MGYLLYVQWWALSCSGLSLWDSLLAEVLLPKPQAFLTLPGRKSYGNDLDHRLVIVPAGCYFYYLHGEILLGRVGKNRSMETLCPSGGPCRAWFHSTTSEVLRPCGWIWTSWRLGTRDIADKCISLLPQHQNVPTSMTCKFLISWLQVVPWVWTMSCIYPEAVASLVNVPMHLLSLPAAILLFAHRTDSLGLHSLIKSTETSASDCFLENAGEIPCFPENKT